MTERPVGVTDQAAGAGVAEVRTRERSVGGNTVAEQYVIPIPEAVKTGVYIAHAGKFRVLAAAQSANTAGFVWLLNQSTATVVRVRRIEFMSAPSAATAFVSAPRVTVWRMTATGTPTGAAVTPAKARRTTQNGITADAAAVATLRTAITGLTVTEAERVHSFTVTPILTAVGGVVPIEQTYHPIEDDGRANLANGEGIVIRQEDAGTASDTRDFTINLSWEEVTLP